MNTGWVSLAVAVLTLWGGQPAVAASAEASGTTYAYVVDQDKNTVERIDLATGQRSGVPTNGHQPRHVAATRDGSRLYVSSIGQVAVVDTINNVELTRIELPERGTLALSPDGSRLWHTRAFGTTVLDTTTNRIVKELRFPGHTTETVLTPDGLLAYVPSGGGREKVDGVVSIVDTRTYETVGTIPLPGWGRGYNIGKSAVTPDGSKLYVRTSENGMYIVDTAHRHATHVSFGDGIGLLAFSQDSRKVYLTGHFGSDQLSVADVGGNAVSRTIQLPAPAMNFVAYHDRVFGFTSGLWGEGPIVSVIDAEQDTVVDQFSVPGGVDNLVVVRVPPSPRVSTLTLESGGGQTAEPGVAFAQPLVVRAEYEGLPVSNALVRFSVLGEPDSFFLVDGHPQQTADVLAVRGMATSPSLVAGTKRLGEFTVKVTVVHYPGVPAVNATETVAKTPPLVSSVETDPSVDGQSAETGEPFPARLRAKALHSGDPVAEADLLFEIVSPDATGTLFPGGETSVKVRTAEDGWAVAPVLKAGAVPGEVVIRVTSVHSTGAKAGEYRMHVKQTGACGPLKEHQICARLEIQDHPQDVKVAMQFLYDGAVHAELTSGAKATVVDTILDRSEQIVVKLIPWPHQDLETGSVYFVENRESQLIDVAADSQLPQHLSYKRKPGTNEFTFIWNGPIS